MFGVFWVNAAENAPLSVASFGQRQRCQPGSAFDERQQVWEKVSVYTPNLARMKSGQALIFVMIRQSEVLDSGYEAH